MTADRTVAPGEPIIPEESLESQPSQGHQSALPTDLGRRAAGGIGWTGMSQAVRIIGQMVLQVVMARLLLPEDFGMMAQAQVLGAFATVLAEMGVESAIAQRRNLPDKVVTGVFVLVVGAAIVLGLVMAGGADRIASFFSEPDVADLVRIVAISFPLVAAGAVQRGLLAQRLQFQRLAIVDVAAFIVGATAAIGLAATGFGPRSLAVQVTVTALVSCIGLWLASGWRPTSLGQSDPKPLLRPIGGLLGFNAVNYWARNADNMLIGRFLGASALGLYSRAYVLMLFPITQMGWVASRVMVPALSEIYHDIPRQREAYFRAVRLLALAAFPLMAGLFGVADQFVEVVLGPGWDGLAPILRVLSVVGMGHVVFTTTGWIFLARRRTDLMWRWGVFASAVIVAGFALGVWYGTPLAVAISYLITSFVVLGYPVLAIPLALMNARVGDLLRQLVSTALVAVFGACVAWATGWLLTDLEPFLRFGASVLAGAIAYAAGCAVLRPRAWQDATVLAGQAWRKRRP